ncbi:hypothetical protein BAUCODRAFT_89239 [Baudoinia panamericana UAMH 10762]|uniref:t-SNARE coiled-coil homology domain-containing protein n=1 Tax=Baudoinia panamericana (strain UAMH 10762) TaxID=717646 RepID=M2NBS4_BAUPA|nr:uncharacterized protein BAUCODRAFT_89239 [Baudoinia panamericana UAMH 10762]EMC96350.1 hypothetical protein BAUCODRAFT_89239 [Baudoinia panamericana UAMH 10762]
MASRFQRDSRSALFSSYDAAQSHQRSRPSSAAANPTRSTPYSTHHSNNSSPYAFGNSYNNNSNNDSTQLSAQPPSGAGFSPAYANAYPGSERHSGDSGYGSSNAGAGFRPATPNKKGQYSDAVIDELESQNEDQVGEMGKKVRMLKDLTVAIGDEIRDSTAFAEKMNEGFESTRNRLQGTMNRMLRMADRTGIGWRIWLGFFVCIFFLFAYVWLF